MPSLNERDFSKLASAAAKDLVDHGIPLNDSVDKIASSHDMNDEQLRRLCEATNNAAFNAMFEHKGKTGSADRIVEFDVAKPGEILKRRVGSAKQAMSKTASAQSFDRSWESRPLERREPAQEKTASSPFFKHMPELADAVSPSVLRMVEEYPAHQHGMLADAARRVAGGADIWDPGVMAPAIRGMGGRDVVEQLVEAARQKGVKLGSATSDLESYTARRDKAANARTIDKALSHLRHEKIAAELAYADASDRLYRHFRAMDRRPKFGEFEKDAMALHGPAAEGTLDTLRKRLGLPAVTRNYAKTASRIVVSARGEEHQFLKKALDALDKVSAIQATLTNHNA
jgi:hypothetical protein